MTARRSLLLCSALGVLVTLSGGGALAQDAPLRYRWTEGEAVRYRTTTESSVVMSGLPGLGDMAVTNVATQTYLITAEKVAADGAATLKTVFDAIRMDMTSPAMSVSYDSASPTTPSDPTVAEIARMFGQMLGESVVVTIAADGTVRAVEGTAQIRQKVEGTSAAASAMSMLGGGLEVFLSDEAMRGTFSQMFAKLPDKPARIGDSWTSEISVPNPAGRQTITSTFTLKGVERIDGRDLTKIGVAQAIKTAPGGAMGPFTIQAGDAAGTGEILFDHVVGRPERASMTSTMPMTMSMTGPDGSALSVQSTTTSKLTIEFVKK